MKRSAVIFSIASAFLIAPQARADNLPPRKAGLWEITVGAAGRPAQAMKQCIDSATDAKMMQMGGDMAGKMGCQSSGVQKQGDKYISQSTCNFNGSKVNSSSTFSGDFSTQYSGESTSTYDPPLMGMSTMSSTISAKYLGPCEAGQAPGDLIMPGGMKVNINSIGKGMPAMPPKGAH